MDLLNILQFALIVFVVVYLTTNMLSLVRLRPVYGSLPAHPFISVCVPARNEARDIEACLRSLLQQDYPGFEVIVVDDHSTDRTPEIIQRLADEDPRLKVLTGDALPAGWFGKPFALHQAAALAQGEYLLFTDADPVFRPHALTSAVHAMQSGGLDLLTLMPGTQFLSFWERAVQPVVFGFIAALTRFKNVNDPENPSAMGIGAFILVKRETYERVGGHQRVKAEIVEDIAFAKYAKQEGARLLIADGKELLNIRMYHSLHEIWVGWRKNLFTALRWSVIRTFYYMLMILGFLMTPYLLFFYNGWSGGINFWTGLSLAGLVLVIAATTQLCRELNLGRGNAFLFPLGALVMVALLFNSMAQWLVTGKTEWRGRKYPSAKTPFNL